MVINEGVFNKTYGAYKIFPHGGSNFSEDLKTLHIDNEDGRSGPSGFSQLTALTSSMNLSSHTILAHKGPRPRPHKNFRESFRRLLPSTDATQHGSWAPGIMAQPLKAHTGTGKKENYQFKFSLFFFFFNNLAFYYYIYAHN